MVTKSDFRSISYSTYCVTECVTELTTSALISLLQVMMSHSFMMQRAQREMHERHGEVSFAYPSTPESLRVPPFPSPEMTFGKTMEMLLTPSASRHLAFTSTSGIIFSAWLCKLDAGTHPDMQECTVRPHHIIYRASASRRLPVLSCIVYTAEAEHADRFLDSRLSASMTWFRWLMCRGSVCCHVYACLVLTSN